MQPGGHSRQYADSVSMVDGTAEDTGRSLWRGGGESTEPVGGLS
jgi:hypothetical protein